MYAFPKPLDLLPLESQKQTLDPPVVMAAFLFCVRQTWTLLKFRLLPKKKHLNLEVSVFQPGL